MYENTLLLGTGDNTFIFNTKDTGAAPITLAGTPSLACRVNGGAAATSGLTLDVDYDDGGGAITGQHQVTLDVDDGTLSLADGDLIEIYIAAGTVDSVSVVGTVIARLSISDGSLQTQTKTDILDALTSDDTKIAAGDLNTLTGHDPGATIAAAGDQMDLVDAPNATALAALVAALLAAVIEGTVTLKQSLALANAAAAGKLSGAATTSIAIRNLADTLDRIAATVDANGNRSAITTTYTDL